MSEICHRTFEPVAPSQRAYTHTCSLPSGHDDSHYCPRCGEHWDDEQDTAGSVTLRDGRA